MFDDDDRARRRGPPRKGQFKPGQSGNPKGRPKNSKNIKTYIDILLGELIQVVDNGETRKIPRAKAIAIQLVNIAAKGDPKGLAAILSFTRDFDETAARIREVSVTRAEDLSVLDGIVDRIRASTASSAATEDKGDAEFIVAETSEVGVSVQSDDRSEEPSGPKKTTPK